MWASVGRLVPRYGARATGGGTAAAAAAAAGPHGPGRPPSAGRSSGEWRRSAAGARIGGRLWREGAGRRAGRGAGKPAARHLPVNGHSIAASAVDAEPRLQPRTEPRDHPNLSAARPSSIARPSSSTSSVAFRCAGKPAARHVPVNGQGIAASQCIAASAVDAEPRLQPRTERRYLPRYSKVLLGPPQRLARTWQHVLPRRPASTAAPPAAPRSRSL